MRAMRQTFAQHPGGWVGLAMRELIQTIDTNFDINAYLEQLRQEISDRLGNAADLRDFYRHPEDYLFLKILPSKSDYDYREPLILRISLTNMSSIAISMGPGMMVNPRVLMSARLSGGLKMELKHYDFASLYKKRRMDVGQGLSDSIRLDRGKLRGLLRRCPQETITIRISCILDPQVVGQDEYLPSLGGQTSKEVVLVRYGFRPSPKAMERLYQVLKEGPVRSKIATAILLGDLLANSQNPDAIPEAKKPRAVNEEKITSTLVTVARETDWKVRAWFGEALQYARLDGDLSTALADQIRDPHWLVRLMAVRTAGNRGQNWSEILRRVAQTDSDRLVRQMASNYVSSSPTPGEK